MAALGLTVISMGSQINFSRSAMNAARKEQAFIDLVSATQKAAISPSICTTALQSTTPTVGAPVSFTTGGLNLTAGANYQNGLIVIKNIQWLIVDQPSNAQWIGYLSVQADLGGSGNSTVLGGSIHNSPRVAEDPRSGVKVLLQMNPLTHQVVSCSSVDTRTQFFKIAITLWDNHNTSRYNGWQALPVAYSDANYYVICNMMDPWAINHDASGESFGFISTWGYSAAGFSWHYPSPNRGLVASPLHAQCGMRVVSSMIKPSSLLLILTFKARHLKSTAGSSILEVVIVAGIMGIAMLGVASQMSFSEQASDGLKKDLVFIDLVGQIQQVLSSNALCTTSLAGIIPVVNTGVTLTSGSQTFAAATTYQNPNGQILIQTLQWSQLTPVSLTEQVGYMSLQADLSNGTGKTIVGGNTRSFPKPGSNPPGMLIHMNMDPFTGKITACGPFNVDTSSTKYFSFPITTNDINDKRSLGGTVFLPGPPYPDNNYTVNCGIVNSNFGAAGKFFGELYVVSTTATSLVWHYEQEIDDYVAPGTTFQGTCTTFHY